MDAGIAISYFYYTGKALKNNEIKIEKAEKAAATQVQPIFELLIAELGYCNLKGVFLRIAVCSGRYAKSGSKYKEGNLGFTVGDYGLSENDLFSLSDEGKVEFFVNLAKYSVYKIGKKNKNKTLIDLGDGPHIAELDLFFSGPKRKEVKSDEISVDVIFKISDDPLGSDEAHALRQEIEEHLGDFLNENDLGEVSGGSIGAGTMEVFCEVKSFAKGKRAILKFLKDNGYPTPISVAKIEDD